MITQAGAKPVFFMTWGRRDGDGENKKVNPDYTTMQDNLSKAYRAAAKRNRAVIAPVGEAWRLVWKKDHELARQLYARDGSHPSAKGAFLNACVLYAVLFDANPTQSKFTSTLGEKEAGLLKAIAWTAVTKERTLRQKTLRRAKKNDDRVSSSSVGEALAYSTRGS